MSEKASPRRPAPPRVAPASGAGGGHDTMSGPARTVLHVGCGPRGGGRLHAVFEDSSVWHELRLDLDPAVSPDIVASIADMRAVVRSGSVDAVWSSHNIEHLAAHEVLPALREFRRVIRADGFVLIRCPDLQAVLRAALDIGLDATAYQSPAGPITPLDMIYGHGASVAAGNRFMAHHTGFTDERLGRLLVEAGFARVHTRSMARFDLWALALADEAAAEFHLPALSRAGLDFSA